MAATGCGGPACGDGVTDAPTEQCDDGNLNALDGCSILCTVEADYMCSGTPSVCSPIATVCGDNERTGMEQCDTGGVDSTSCDSDCTNVRCGDMHTNRAAGEQCDDGNTVSGDGCSPTCQTESADCGNGTCDADETCTSCVADCANTLACMCQDADGDGYYDRACGGDDCNDTRADIHPGATEIQCDGFDNDCVGGDLRVDQDMDSFLCGPTSDCDDTNPNVNPRRPEICGDGIDNDCNPATTEDTDLDGDGYTCATDCNDSNPDIHPGQPEICNNSVDDDCNRATPDVFDRNGDGIFCNEGPDECLTYEICGDGFDNDCNPATLDTVVDTDGDGFDCRTDCDDNNNAVFPDANGFCGPAVDILYDFEADAQGWVASPGTGDMAPWVRGTPNTTATRMAYSGTNVWATNLTGTYTDEGETIYLTSPAINLSTSNTDATLVFQQSFSTESSDRVRVELSLDGGTNWSVLGGGTGSSNWYTGTTTSSGWSGSTGTSGAWRRVSHPLRGSARNANVRIRVLFDPDGSVDYPGFALDDVRITNRVIDLSVGSMTLEQPECGTTGTLVAGIQNNSANVIASLAATLTVNGGTAMPITLAGPFASNTSTTVRVPVTLPTAAGSATFALALTITDNDMTNNTRSLMLTLSARSASIPVTASSPYTQTFEVDDGGWASSGTLSSWSRTTPTGAFITGAGAGASALVTGGLQAIPTGGDGGVADADVGDGGTRWIGFSPGQNSQVTSPCFDFSTLTLDPVLSALTISDTEVVATSMQAADGAWLEVWTPSTGWTVLGSMATGTNWYNQAASAGGGRPPAMFAGRVGTAGQWRTSTHPATGTAGQAAVRFRVRFRADASPNPSADGYVAEGFGIDNITLTP